MIQPSRWSTSHHIGLQVFLLTSWSIIHSTFSIWLPIFVPQFHGEDGRWYWNNFTTGWLTRWLHRGERGAVVCLCTSPHTDPPFIRMHELVIYELRLSVTASRYRRPLHGSSVSESGITPHKGLWCIELPLMRPGWSSVQNIGCPIWTWRRVLIRRIATALLPCWSGNAKVRFFIARFSDRSVMYVGVVAFDWVLYSAHRCFGVPAHTVLSSCNNLVPYTRETQRHLIHVAALTKFTVCTVIRFFLATPNGI